MTKTIYFVTAVCSFITAVLFYIDSHSLIGTFGWVITGILQIVLWKISVQIEAIAEAIEKGTK